MISTAKLESSFVTMPSRKTKHRSNMTTTGGRPNKIQKFESGLEFYKSLKDENINGNFIVNNAVSIAENLDEDDDLKVNLVSFYVLLYHDYRNPNNNGRKTTESPSANDRKRGSLESKTIRANAIPEYFHRLQSTSAKLAVALFSLSNFSDTPRKKKFFLLSIIFHDVMQKKSMSEILAICRSGNISEQAAVFQKIYDASSKTLLTENAETIHEFVEALIEISNLIKDRQCAKIAYELDKKIYFKTLLEYIDAKDVKLNTLAPFEPMINAYIYERVARCEQENYKAIIVRQSRVNLANTFRPLIGELMIRPKKPQAKTEQFENDKCYQYYKGATTFSRYLSFTYHIEGNRRYRIITFNDALFDVIGVEDSVQDPDSGTKVNTERMYNKLDWRTRLSSIGFRAKVEIHKAMGSELNKLIGKGGMRVSWMDDGYSYEKDVVIVPKKESNSSNNV